MLPIILAVIGGFFALQFIKGSVAEWKPIAAAQTLLPNQLDTYAYLAQQKAGTMVKFAVAATAGSQAVLVGAVQRVGVENGVRVWDVRVVQLLVIIGTQTAPSNGTAFRLTDANLLP